MSIIVYRLYNLVKFDPLICLHIWKFKRPSREVIGGWRGVWGYGFEEKRCILKFAMAYMIL